MQASVNAAAAAAVEIGFFAEKGPTERERTTTTTPSPDNKSAKGRKESEKFVLANQSFGRGKQR